MCEREWRGDERRMRPGRYRTALGDKRMQLFVFLNGSRFNYGLTSLNTQYGSMKIWKILPIVVLNTLHAALFNAPPLCKLAPYPFVHGHPMALPLVEPPAQ